MNDFDRAISTPITSSASYTYKNCKEAEEIFAGNASCPLYARMGNPTSNILEQKISKMDNGIAAIATSSGMGAISMALMSLVESGDEIIAVGGLFGGSYALLSQTLSRFGIKTKFFSVDELDNIANNITENTKIIFCESVGNPNLRLPNLEKLGDIATKYNIAFVVDNTTTPMTLNPLEFGADISVYSTTKILTGNSSALGGIAVARAIKDGDKFYDNKYAFLKPFIKKLGSKALVGCMKKRALRDLGMSANPYSSYQTILGLETLKLRTEKVATSCKIIAKTLKDNGINVNHPSLTEHADHELYKTIYKCNSGSLLTIDLGTKENVFKFLDSSKLLTLTVNLGDSRTLALHMASTIYSDFSKEEKEFLGITDGLIRLSIGLENPQDIIDDILNCFKSIK